MCSHTTSARRRPRTIHFWRGDLPHWEVEDGRYFVTIHLHGAIPAVGCQRIREMAAQHRTASVIADDQGLRRARLIFREMERWLDRTSHVAHLQDSRVAQVILEAIQHRSVTHVWHMLEFVIMPTHIHLFFELHEDTRLKKCLELFKRWTGHQAAKLVPLTNDRFWQPEWFDHWSRSDDEDENIVYYIRRNPEKACLVDDYRRWPYGSWGC